MKKERRRSWHMQAELWSTMRKTKFLLEMLDVSWAMDYFDTYLKGGKFKLFTDHKPLEKLSTIHSKPSTDFKSK